MKSKGTISLGLFKLGIQTIEKKQKSHYYSFYGGKSFITTIQSGCSAVGTGGGAEGHCKFLNDKIDKNTNFAKLPSAK